MSDKYLFRGPHADILASGRPVAPGDGVPAAAVDPDDPHDQALLEAGHLFEPAREKKETR